MDKYSSESAVGERKGDALIIGTESCVGYG